MLFCRYQKEKQLKRLHLCLSGRQSPFLVKEKRKCECQHDPFAPWSTHTPDFYILSIRVGQGPTALAVGAGGEGDVWTFFLSSIISFFLPLSGRRPDTD